MQDAPGQPTLALLQQNKKDWMPKHPAREFIPAI